MFVCTCSFRGPHGRLALPNELPSLNKDFHFTFTSLHRTSGSWEDFLRFLPYEPRHEKTNILVSNLVRHKPGCKATEDG